jgi:hypothetical protein
MPIAAEKAGRKIAVEVKSFLGRSPMTELERALGQFAIYRFAISRDEPDRALFLAIPDTAYDAVLDTADARDLIMAMNVRLLLYNTETEQIVRWIE